MYVRFDYPDFSFCSSLVLYLMFLTWQSTSDVGQYRRTTADCVVLMMRFYMTNFDTTYTKHSMNGNKHHEHIYGGQNLEVSVLSEETIDDLGETHGFSTSLAVY